MELPFFSPVMPFTKNVQPIPQPVDSSTVCVCLVDQFVFNSYVISFIFFQPFQKKLLQSASNFFSHTYSRHFPESDTNPH